MNPTYGVLQSHIAHCEKNKMNCIRMKCFYDVFIIYRVVSAGVVRTAVGFTA